MAAGKPLRAQEKLYPERLGIHADEALRWSGYQIGSKRYFCHNVFMMLEK